jgi:hypothetical protein
MDFFAELPPWAAQNGATLLSALLSAASADCAQRDLEDR